MAQEMASRGSRFERARAQMMYETEAIGKGTEETTSKELTIIKQTDNVED